MLVASMRRPPEILDDQGISQKSNRRGGTKWRSSSSWTIWRTRWAGWRSQMLSWCKVTTRMSSRVRLWCRIPCGHIIVPKDTNQESFSLALCGVSYGLFVTWRPWITITNNPNETPHKANDKMTIGHYDLKCGVQRPQAIGQLQSLSHEGFVLRRHWRTWLLLRIDALYQLNICDLQLNYLAL